MTAVKNACHQLFCELRVVRGLERPQEANLAVSLGPPPWPTASRLEQLSLPQEGAADVGAVLSNLRGALARARATAALEALRRGQVGV